MSMTDPIADMLTRIRNALSSAHPEVEMPASKMKQAIAAILQEEGYIAGFERIEDNKQGILRIALKYGPQKQPVITGLKRISKPGRRIYVKRNNIPKVLNGLGIAILSTPKGVMTGVQSARAKVGGEVICYVW
jgi:small subunit ribosomal protein S8